MKNNNEGITDITEVIEDNTSHRVNRIDVSGYKWKLVSDNQNEPKQVHFYKEDLNDKLSVSLTTLFDRCLKEYKHHLEEVEKDEKQKVRQEIRDKRDKLLNSKLDELIENYESFMIFVVKNELNDRMTNEDNYYHEEGWKFNLKDIRIVVDYYFKECRGIGLGIGSPKQNSFRVNDDWYLKNYQKIKEIILSVRPDYEPPSYPISENEFGCKFMNLENQNRKVGNTYNPYHDPYLPYADTATMRGFYDKLIDLHRKMKTEKISYWKS